MSAGKAAGTAPGAVTAAVRLVGNSETGANLIRHLVNRLELGFGGGWQRRRLERLLGSDQDAGQFASQLAAQVSLGGVPRQAAFLLGTAEGGLDIAHHPFHAADREVDEDGRGSSEVFDQHVNRFGARLEQALVDDNGGEFLLAQANQRGTNVTREFGLYASGGQ